MATPVNAPMVGKILTIVGSVGDHVDEDETILVMEAMKMEIEVVAPAAGVIAEIRVAPGDAVDPDTVVATIDEA
ncbi:MAG TPA: acetyl-CoA carboxylase biotin carboxyl carrier protein subunit [Chloroflexota bacterium]|nr:acetyl-CoA carboxylase biotin carboxyl carrier protein subunit [Chloroflexota bacterium]